jgi:hypothetical protein
MVIHPSIRSTASFEGLSNTELCIDRILECHVCKPDHPMNSHENLCFATNFLSIITLRMLEVAEKLNTVAWHSNRLSPSLTILIRAILVIFNGIVHVYVL